MNYLGMNYIDGGFRGGTGRERPDFNNENPATLQNIGTFPSSTSEEVTEAVAAAHRAFQEWRGVSRVQRADYFDKLSQLMKRDHEKLVNIISLETGKNTNEAHAEVIEALHMCQVAMAFGRQSYGQVVASELSTKDSQVIRKPKGVVAVISPWNFPLAIGSFWCSAPAIVEGNCVVHKPSELTPMTAQMAAELYKEAGFPPGVYNMVHGAGDVGDMLVKQDKVQTILFTGSAEVGQLIRKHCADTWHKNCSCELGSKSATIVFEDGDLNLALDVTIASAFKLSGQRCVSSGRMLIQRSIFDGFVQRFVDRAGSLTTGNPFAKLEDGETPFYGPLISAEQRDRVEAFNEMVRVDSQDDFNGAKVLLDSERVEGGHYLTPFVYTCEWADKPFLKQEVFGPHVALIPFNDLDDAIRIYNDTDYGLALGAVTDDFRKHRRLRDECNTGMLYINGGSIAAESHLPFGGVGKSGNGYKSAVGTYHAVTEEIAVTTNYEHGISWAQGMK